MARRTSRRSLSVQGLLYRTIKDACESLGCSISSFVQVAVVKELRARGLEVPEGVDADLRELTESDRRRIVAAQQAGRKRRERAIVDGRAHFTF